MKGLIRRAKPDGKTAGRLLIAALLVTLFSFLLFWRLGTLTDGLSPAEYKSRQNNNGVEQIVRNGLDAPLNLLQYGYTSGLGSSNAALRLASVTAAVIIILFLFLMLRSLFGMTVGLLALLIVGATPWGILAARSAAPYVMMLWLIVPVACFVLMGRAKRRTEIWWLLLCIALAISLYTPGLVWFIAGAALFSARRFSAVTQRINSVFLIIGIAVAILALIPLAASLAVEPARIKHLMLIPPDWPGLSETLKSLGWAFIGLFWSIRSHIDIGIGQLPMFNILQSALLIFGIYALGSRMRNITLALGAWLLLAVLLSGINNNPHLLLFGLPAAGVLVAAGLRLLYIEWRRVFPLNPFAYALAMSLIILVVGAHLFYSIRYTLVAWPRTPETKATYVLK
ncbi:MAG TPA: glycosyltransferase family 39 protein [Candidatus Saccharimonadales bacterium]|nr:glycosyltransferase family 39 protein [Candidatus Saccharimonadales bacterium]